MSAQWRQLLEIPHARHVLLGRVIANASIGEDIARPTRQVRQQMPDPGTFRDLLVPHPEVRQIRSDRRLKI